MSVVELWRDNLTHFAESHRKTKAFGPEHPAVRAAKRYCDRTGATWEIGIGGQCELGKRALKQWGYELWQNMTARWAIILLPLLAIIGLGLVINARSTGIVLTVIVGIVYVLAGLLLGFYVEDRDDGWQTLPKSSVERKRLLVAFLVTIPVSGLAYLIARLLRRELVVKIVLGALILALIVAILGMLFEIGMRVGWVSLLIGLLIFAGMVAALLGVVVLAGFVAGKVAETNQERREAALEARRNDVSVQRAVRDSLDGALRSYYKRNKGFALDKSTFPEFDAWRDRFEEMLTEHGYVWEDLLTGWPYSKFTWLHYEDNYDFTGSFMSELHERWEQQEIAKAHRNEQGRAKVRNMLGFVAASLFLLKSRVCPNVVLPKRDQVLA